MFLKGDRVVVKDVLDYPMWGIVIEPIGKFGRSKIRIPRSIGDFYYTYHPKNVEFRTAYHV